MYKHSYIVFAAIVMLFAVSCQQATAKNELPASRFKNMLDSIKDRTILDVRTLGEYMAGHLQDARNIDWNSDTFEVAVSHIDRSKPVFVYCLAGSRSAGAAEKLRHMGFAEVYELRGGIIKWRNAGLPEEGTSVRKEMTQRDFEAVLNTDKIVLIDFYAPWCVPCRQMEPVLKEIAQDYDATVKVFRIDADIHRQLAIDLDVQQLPTFLVYHNQQLIWRGIGFQPKVDLEAVLKSVK
jgi:thioredoxin 1